MTQVDERLVDANCGNCVYWKRMAVPGSLKPAGTCHCDPPQVVGVMTQTQYGPQLASNTFWPMVPADEWCGQHKAPQEIEHKMTPIDWARVPLPQDNTAEPEPSE